MNSESTKKSNDEPLPAQLKSYERPAVVDTASFETLAMTCGKVSGGFCQARGGVTNS